MSFPSVGINVIASAVVVLGWMTFINNFGDEQFVDFAKSQFGKLAMYTGIFFTSCCEHIQE